MKKELENRLRECLAKQEPQEDTAAYRETLFLAKREAQRKAQRERAGFGHFLVWYIRHSGVRIWLVQAGILACIGFLMLRGYDLLYLCTPRRISIVLCGLTVFIFMAALPVFYRSHRYKMLEVEAAARLSSARLFLAEVIAIAAGDVLMLGTVAGITVAKSSYSLSSALLYLALPFLTMWCVAFRLMRHAGIEKAIPACAGICVLVLFLFGVLYVHYPACYEGTFSAKWAGVCTALLVFGASQWKGLLEQAAICAHGR